MDSRGPDRRIVDVEEEFGEPISPWSLLVIGAIVGAIVVLVAIDNKVRKLPEAPARPAAEAPAPPAAAAAAPTPPAAPAEPAGGSEA